MISSFRSATGRGLIAKELALELAEGTFEPQKITHLPGISNDLADALSRLAEERAQVPDILKDVPRCTPPRRTAPYYRTEVAGGAK